MLPTDESAAAAAQIAGRQRIAVLVPCYNEEAAIGKVVADFRAALPDAAIYVYDNNSTDRTVEAAAAAGAVVRREPHQGKGHVVRRMFTDIDADIYVLVDGDATYDAPSAPAMIDTLVHDRLDMVVAVRVDREEAAYRPGHRAGNWLLTGFVAHVFGAVVHRHAVGLSGVLAPLREILSGAVGRLRDRDRADRPCARAGTAGRRDADAVLCAAGGLGLQAQHLARRLPHPAHHPQALSRRAAAAVLRRASASSLAIVSIGLAIPIFVTYLQEGLVPRLPTAMLSTGLMLLAFLSVACGLILDTVTRGRRELKLLAYLAQRAPAEERRRS